MYPEVRGDPRACARRVEQFWRPNPEFVVARLCACRTACVCAETQDGIPGDQSRRAAARRPPTSRSAIATARRRTSARSPSSCGLRLYGSSAFVASISARGRRHTERPEDPVLPPFVQHALEVTGFTCEMAETPLEQRRTDAAQQVIQRLGVVLDRGQAYRHALDQHVVDAQIDRAITRGNRLQTPAQALDDAIDVREHGFFLADEMQVDRALADARSSVALRITSASSGSASSICQRPCTASTGQRLSTV